MQRGIGRLVRSRLIGTKSPRPNDRAFCSHQHNRHVAAVDDTILLFVVERSCSSSTTINPSWKGWRDERAPATTRACPSATARLRQQGLYVGVPLAVRYEPRLESVEELCRERNFRQQDEHPFTGFKRGRHCFEINLGFSRTRDTVQ